MKKKIMILCSLFGTIVIVVAAIAFYERSVSVNEVIITNVTDSAFTVTWTSSKKYEGQIAYGKSDLKPFFSKFGKVAYDDRDVEVTESGSYEKKSTTKRYTHHVTIKDLDPGSTYYFVIPGLIYNKKFNIRSVKTKPLIEKLNTPNPAYGMIASDNLANHDTIVLLGLNSDGNEISELLSTPVSENNTYSIDLSYFNNEQIKATDLYGVIKSGKATNTRYTYTNSSFRPFETIKLKSGNSGSLKKISKVFANGNCPNREGDAVKIKDSPEFKDPESGKSLCQYVNPADLSSIPTLLPNQNISFSACRGTSANTRDGRDGWCITNRQDGNPAYPGYGGGTDSPPTRSNNPINGGSEPIDNPPSTDSGFCGDLGGIKRYRLTKTANIRPEANTSKSAIGKLNANDEVNGCLEPVLGVDPYGGENKAWVLVDYNNSKGYIWSGLISGSITASTSIVVQTSSSVLPQEDIDTSNLNTHEDTVINHQETRLTNSGLIGLIPRNFSANSYNYATRLLPDRDSEDYLEALENTVEGPIRGGRPQYVILHWTGVQQTDCVDSVFNTFRAPLRNYNGVIGPNKCSNYVVNQDGSGALLNEIGNACVQATNRVLNSGLGFSIENCGNQDLNLSLTNAQVLSNATIIRNMIASGKSVPAESLCVIGHFETAQKSDPGVNFLTAVVRTLHEWGYKVKSNYYSGATSCDIPESASSAQIGLENRVADKALTQSVNKKTLASNDSALGTGFFHSTDPRFLNTTVYYIENKSDVKFFVDSDGDGTRDPNENEVDNATLEKTGSVIKYDLNKGWNPIHIPTVNNELNLASKLHDYINNTGSDITHIAKYSGGKFTIYTKRALPNNIGQDFETEDFGILPNEGYFIFATRNSGFFIEGVALTENNIKLENGWNLIGVNGQLDLNAESFMQKIESNGVEIKVVSDYRNGIYYSKIKEDGITYGNNYNIISKKSYFVRVDNGGGVIVTF